jgi:uncharacterized protein (DUF2147 family)
MKRYTLLFSIILAAANISAQTRGDGNILGIWKSPHHDVMIKVDRIGDVFQGRIVWLSVNGQDEMAFDENNPNERLRNVPLKGNKMIRELIFNPLESVWEGGYYDFSEGKLYKCKVTPYSAEQIKIVRYFTTPQDEVVEIWTRN